MMRKLLLFFAMLCVSIGTWAQGVVVYDTDGTTPIAYLSKTTWTNNGTTEDVVRIKMETAGSLAAAITKYQDLSDYSNVKVAHIYFTDTNTAGLNDADLTALASLNVETIDLQDAFYTSSKTAFTFTNANVKSVILPDGWSKADVNAAGLALAGSGSGTNNFGSCFSMTVHSIVTRDTNGDPVVYNYGSGNTPDGTSVIAYVAKGNTLRNAILHVYDDTHANSKLRYEGMDQHNTRLADVKSLTVSGYPSASDYTESADFDTNGHFIENCTPFEHSFSPNAGGSDGSTTRAPYYDGTKKPGAIAGCAGLLVLDLSDAVIYEAYNNDLTLTWTNALGNLTEQIWIPTSEEVMTIPADFLSDGGLGNLREICIPANIKRIKTRAFASSSHNLVHVWTTGTDNNTVYDNGAYTTSSSSDNDPSDDVKHFGFTDLCTYNEYSNSWGTYTFSPNLECIESYAFATGYRVKDVYCLGTKAPECHVDAFTSVMYNGNNTYDSSAITDGIITREAYTNNKQSRMYMTMLHYPKATTTPDLQRYTDPTREYNVATGERDGKGNTLYFPNQSEFTQAYGQGTTGYLWEAWDNTRTTWGDLEIANGPGILTEHTQVAQQKANDAWTSNKYSGKGDRSFYDVTLDGTEISSFTTQPSGLDYYYNTVWEGSTLYPQAETSTEAHYNYVLATQEDADNNINLYTLSGSDYVSASTYTEGSTYKRVQTQKLVDGEPQYETCNNGHFVKDYQYVADDEGGFVNEPTLNGYVGTTTPVDGVSTYYSDDQGATETAPKVQNGYYLQDGMKDVYTPVDKNNSANIGTQAPYYTKSGDTYTESDLMFNGTYYYPTGETITKDVYTGTGYVVPGVNAYFSDEEGTTPATPGFYSTYYYDVQTITRDKISSGNWLKFGVTTYYSDSECTQEATPIITSITGNGTLYYKDSEGYHQTTTFIPGEGDYYVDLGYGYLEVAQYHPTVTLDRTYYYKDGEETVTEGTPTNTWVGDVTYYKYENNTYEEVTPQINGTYYYKSGTETVDEYLGSTSYISGKSWYSYDQNNKTYSPITLSWYNHFIGDYYYVSGQEANIVSADRTDYDASMTYYSDAAGTTEVETVNFDNTYYYASYTDNYVAYTDQEGQRYTQKEYYRAYADTDGSAQRYCPVMEDVEFFDIKDSHDYRGWHQFVLAAYGKMSKIDYEPVRWWISDNDWWTICEPYDLKYSDLVMFFGTEAKDNNGTAKIPYLSKLMYVVRDGDNGKITLNFSKNLMEYKEMIPGSTNAISGTGYKHGTFSDDQKWSAQELANDPVILHAGVPYLIKPNMTKTGTGTNAYYNRQFDIYADTKADLWSRLATAQNLGGSDLMNLIYEGEYTVPSYVVSGSESTSDSKEIQNKDGSTFTYNAGTITYKGEQKEYKLSNDFTYTFVGSFFKSLMPKNCYFLGWDSKANKAAFWYNKVSNAQSWDWNNETGIICPNFKTEKEIDPASSLKDPARWVLTEDDLALDDFTTGAGAKSYTMDFGATNYFEMEEATGVSEMVVKPLYEETKVFDTNGRYMGNSMQSLPKGVYIVNGKKYVVK